MADKSNPLYIDTNTDFKFSLQEQKDWVSNAIDSYQNLKSSSSLKTKKKLELVFSSDLNQDGEINEKEKRLIMGRLASICQHYEKLFAQYLTDGVISTYNLNRIKSRYPDMIPGYDLEDPFIEKTKISQELTPVYF